MTKKELLAEIGWLRFLLIGAEKEIRGLVLRIHTLEQQRMQDIIREYKKTREIDQ